MRWPHETEQPYGKPHRRWSHSGSVRVYPSRSYLHSAESRRFATGDSTLVVFEMKGVQDRELRNLCRAGFRSDMIHLARWYLGVVSTRSVCQLETFCTCYEGDFWHALVHGRHLVSNLAIPMTTDWNRASALSLNQEPIAQVDRCSSTKKKKKKKSLRRWKDYGDTNDIDEIRKLWLKLMDLIGLRGLWAVRGIDERYDASP